MTGPDIAAAAHMVVFVLFFGCVSLWTYLEERRNERRRERLVRGQIAVVLTELSRSTTRLQPAVRRRWFAPGGVPCALEQSTSPLKPRHVRARATTSLPVPLVLEAVSLDASREPGAEPERRSRTFPSFRILTRDASRVSRPLLNRVAVAIENLHREVAVPVSVSLGARGIALQMSAPPRGRRGDVLARTLMGLVAIFDKEVPEGAIRVLETRISLRHGQCPICRQAAGADSILCSRCGTPHHSDCWSYLGSCGLFGCGERRSA